MTILIVDDIADNRLALSLLLEDFDDMNIIEATNGLEAVNICKSAFVDLVLMDVMMPEMDGIEATSLISKMSKKPMIVAISALDDDKKKNEMLAAGAQDYLSKPINDELFVARIKNYNKLLSSIHERDLKNEWAINPFESRVYAKKILFRVTNESSLGEFWEFFLFGTPTVTDKMSDCLRAVYSAGIFLLKTHSIFDIIIEENDEAWFCTVTKIENYNRDFVCKIITKNFPSGRARFGSVAFSIFLPKAVETKIAETVAKTQEPAEQVVPAQEPSVQKAPSIARGPDDEEEERHLRATFVDKVSAVAFTNDLEPSYFDKIDTLFEREDQLDADLFDLETSGQVSFIHKIGASLGEYAVVIDSLHEFKNISFSLHKLAAFLVALGDEDLGEKKLNRLTITLKGLLSDMTEWRKNIFYDKIALDIHYLDSSLVSSCMQTEHIFAIESMVESEEDFELF
jgi:CheY-like chemotaxis protein